MKKIKTIKTSLLIITFLVIGIITLSAFTNTDPNQDIIGTWINEEDSKWKIEFKSDNKCYWYYNNEQTDAFSFEISSTSPQCGYDVKVDIANPRDYLKLTDHEDGDEYCYEILGLNEESLSISTISLGVKYMYFNKQ